MVGTKADIHHCQLKHHTHEIFKHRLAFIEQHRLPNTEASTFFEGLILKEEIDQVTNLINPTIDKVTVVLIDSQVSFEH